MLRQIGESMKPPDFIQTCTFYMFTIRKTGNTVFSPTKLHAKMGIEQVSKGMGDPQSSPVVSIPSFDHP